MARNEPNFDFYISGLIKFLNLELASRSIGGSLAPQLPSFYTHGVNNTQAQKKVMAPICDNLLSHNGTG